MSNERTVSSVNEKSCCNIYHNARERLTESHLRLTKQIIKTLALVSESKLFLQAPKLAGKFFAMSEDGSRLLLHKPQTERTTR